MQELVTLVDSFGKPIGEALKADVHRGEGQTALHLGFSLFVVNEAGEHLLQRRSDTKLVWPGVLSNACCGHPAPGESLLAAASRRMRDELGGHLEPDSVQVLLPYYRYKTLHRDIEEYEVCPVLFAHYSGELNPAPREVSEVVWVSPSRLRQMIAEAPEQFSPWMLEEIAILQSVRHPNFTP